MPHQIHKSMQIKIDYENIQIKFNDKGVEKPRKRKRKINSKQ